ncbi:hypothetical protein OHS33_21480 [Streptomyces sp. NBC_00536]|uniref:hypothetical protein n=1 Tax=Streptomyces sp. NBC_00536 TaxID=2975769 RepID=UPI002E80A167|nr:hypothetical protein [Streptomyces sp. NBC_00536]WUC80664.1 hypothetical protein OHS33_21480 [Streptomyces sp. NBC_00536]
MSGDSGKDLAVDPKAVEEVVGGLKATTAELGEIGGLMASSAGASFGAGFSALALTGMEAGHPAVASVFEDFCGRWEWGVRALVQGVGGLARDLGLSAGALWEEDQYLQGAFKVGTNSLYGNPHASEDEIEGRSWDEIVHGDPYKPDFSPEADRRAAEDFERTWAEAGRKVSTEGFGGAVVDRVTEVAGVDPALIDRAQAEAARGDQG